MQIFSEKKRFEWIGMLCLSIAGMIGFALLLFEAAQYKAELFGAELLLWSVIGALIGFLLLSVFFFNYTRAFVKRPISRPDENPLSPGVTEKLIEDHPADYVSAVTESTTEMLKPPATLPKK